MFMGKNDWLLVDLPIEQFERKYIAAEKPKERNANGEKENSILYGSK